MPFCFSPAVGSHFLHIRHTLFLHKDLVLGKTFACQTAYIKNGACVSCLCALQGTACSGGPSYAPVTCCRVFLCPAVPHLHSNPLRQLEPLIPVSLGTVHTDSNRLCEGQTQLMRDTRLNAGLTSESVFLLSGCLSAMSNPASNQTNDTLSFPPWSLFTVGRGYKVL